ncbi:MAG: hypothetical protein M0Z75_05395 [Nitrospiraceae bacterium]|nr:hypothetical protein [Nitrospiraceae bacterium]
MELKEIAFGLSGLFSKLVAVTELLGRSALLSNAAFLDEADTILPDARRLTENLSRELSKSAANEPPAMKYASVPGHAERICDHFENFSGLLRAKAAENIHFSDKAMGEMNYMIGRLKDMLSNASGMLLAGDAFTAEYMRQAELSVLKSACDFAALHDERLREGICLPKASSLYLSMLEGMKAAAWHLKEMTRDLLE